MAITISGQNNNDKILASDGVLDSISGFNVVGVLTATTFETTAFNANHINVGSTIQLGNAGIITATTLVGNVQGNINHTSNLLLQISGSEKFRVGTSGQLGIGGANYGTSGQVLTSGGSGSAASWSTITGTTINNNADNRVITGSGTANTLNGEANLTFSGQTLEVHNIIKLSDAGFLKFGVSNTAFVRGKDDTDGYLQLGTGGAERVRITSAGRLGIGVNDPDAKLEVLEDIFVKGSSGDGDTGIQIRSGSSALSNQHQIRTGGGNGNMLFLEAVGNTGIIAMETAGSEKLRIASDGKVTTSTTGLISHDFGTTSSTGAYLHFDLGANGANIGYMGPGNHLVTGAAVSDLAIRSGANLVFSTSGATERLRIDSSGHMGLGVTPNANWPTNNDFKALQIGTGACLFGRGSGDEDRGGMAVNWYSDGSNNKYIGNGNAARIYLADGNIYFSNAGANSSGANASMTLQDRMILDSNGNLNIGAAGSGNASVYARHILMSGSSNQGMTIHTTDTSGSNRKCCLFFGTGTSVADMADGMLFYDHNGQYMHLSVNGAGTGVTKASIRLHGDGTVRFDSTPTTTNSISLRLKSHKARAVNDNNGILFTDANDHSQAAIYVQKKSTSNGSSDLVFSTSSGQVVASLQGIPERMRIDKDGNVTKPSNAAFHVTGTAAGVAVSQYGVVKMPFNTETGSSGYFDNGAHYDTGNYRFTAPVSGIYFFYASILNFPSTNSGYFTLTGAKNGSRDYSYGFARFNSANSQTDVNFSTTISLSANDYFEIMYEAANGSNFNYYISGGHGHFFGFLLQ